MSIRKHMDMRKKLLMALAAEKRGGAVAGFKGKGVPGFEGGSVDGFTGKGMDPLMMQAGQGFWSSIATGIKKLAPIALRVFKPAVKAGAAAFQASKKDKFGKRLLEGLEAGGKALAGEVGSELHKAFGGKGLAALGNAPAGRHQQAKPRLLMRPKL